MRVTVFGVREMVVTQPFPRRPHPEHVAALAALAAWQPAGDLAAMLEDVEVTPSEFLGPVTLGQRTKSQSRGVSRISRWTVPSARSNRLAITSQFNPKPSNS